MKLKAKVEVNGKEIEMDIEVSEKELAKLQKEEKKDTGYGFGHIDDIHYVPHLDGSVTSIGDDFVMADIDRACNLYHNRTLAENNARADSLMRQLRRFSVEHSNKPISFSTDKWYEIFYDYISKQLKVEDMSDCRYFGTILFRTSEIAQLAIDTFHNELLWYFTEYKDCK